jgi:hypothetical protein
MPRDLEHPRLARTDRFRTSCSALSALAQWEQLGVAPGDIRLIFHGQTHPSRSQIIEQHPAAGSPVLHGQEVRLDLALNSMADEFPERFFVSLAGAEGRAQMADARRIFAPFDKEQLLARARLHRWNGVFSGALQDPGFARALFEVLGLEPRSLERARQVMDEAALQDWLRILPLLHRVTGERRVAAALLARFLGDPVTIEDAHPCPVTAVTCGQGDSTVLAAARLGRAALGGAVAYAGNQTRVRIGPLSPERGRQYVPHTWDPRMEGSQGIYGVELGPVCELEQIWRDWETGRHRQDPHCLPLAGQWPLILYLLEHFLPAQQTVQVDLLIDMRTRWKLGAADPETLETQRPPEPYSARLGAGCVLACTHASRAQERGNPGARA